MICKIDLLENPEPATAMMQHVVPSFWSSCLLSLRLGRGPVL